MLDLQVSLKMHYQRKLSGFPEVSSEKTKPSTPTPKKRAASVAALSSAQHSKHSRPSVTLCGSGLLAVAAYVSLEDSVPHAGASQAGQLELLAQSKPTDHSNTNGPVATPGKPWKGASRIILLCASGTSHRQLIVGRHMCSILPGFPTESTVLKALRGCTAWG